MSLKTVRLNDEHRIYSAGRWLQPQRYVVGWPSGIVKVGSTFNGRQRWGAFLSRGGELLDLASFVDDTDAEVRLQTKLCELYPPAFTSKEQAVPFLGSRGAGYLECYRIPPDDWPSIQLLAREEMSCLGSP